MSLLAGAALVGFALAVAITDIRWRRIPNGLTAGLAAAGLLLAWTAGASSGVLALGGFVVSLGVGLGLFALKTLGAGDAKFLAAIGAWAGWERLPAAYLAMLGGGAVFALLWSLRHRVLGATMASTSAMIGAAVSSGDRLPPAIGGTAAGKFPYGVGLAIGAVAWWFWAGGTLP